MVFSEIEEKQRGMRYEPCEEWRRNLMVQKSSLFKNGWLHQYSEKRHAANKRGDFVAARRHFRAAFDLSRKPEAAISAANMAAKNGEVQAALDESSQENKRCQNMISALELQVRLMLRLAQDGWMAGWGAPAPAPDTSGRTRRCG